MFKKNAWKYYSEEQLAKVSTLAEGYTQYISDCKTERECVTRAIELAKEQGFRDLQEILAKGETLKPGDKIYASQMGKQLVLAVMGTEPLEKGMRILGAHVDSPRIDVKQNPLYENTDLAYLDTHYYGGIKKYQWVAIPLALHGVVVKKDGTVIPVTIGEDPADPVFCVSDLLIHLSAHQMTKNASTVVEGENLDLLIASRPVIKLSAEADGASDAEKDEKDAVKKQVLEQLKKYDMEEEDFLSAEFEIVPAGKARDMGLDRSMILGYGHDDRVCAYPSLMAILESKQPKYTSVCLLVDKEEIGSVGATGMQSQFFANMVAEMIACSENAATYSDLQLRRAMMQSMMLSSDVSAGFDPLYASAFEKKNASLMGYGVVFNKFTGSRGKSGSNDANAEYMARIRRLMDENDIVYQTAELGKVDEGGGGTIAYILANYGMQVIDSGVAVLNMHAPWEVISKADLYEAFRCYVAFLAMED